MKPVKIWLSKPKGNNDNVYSDFFSSLDAYSGHSASSTPDHASPRCGRKAVLRLLPLPHWPQRLVRRLAGAPWSLYQRPAFGIQQSSLLASYYPRYFGYYERAVTVYTHTSDQYSVFGPRIISCSPREALYVLDGLLENNTILRLRERRTLQGIEAVEMIRKGRVGWLAKSFANAPIKSFDQVTETGRVNAK